MNYEYEFKGGEIVPYAPTVVGDPAEEPWEDYLVRLGYQVKSEYHLGPEDGNGEGLSWHARSEGSKAPHEYLAVWSDCFRCRNIFVTNWGDLLRLQALVAPIIQVGILEHRLSSLDGLATRSFRAWHGHGEYGSCYTCDPEGMKRREEHLAKKAKECVKSAQG